MAWQVARRLRKPGKWTRILEHRSMMTRSTRARSISTPRKLKYVSIALGIISYTLETSSHICILKTTVYEIMEITGDHWISSVGFSSWWNFWEAGRRALRVDLENTAKMQEHACSSTGGPMKASSLPSNLPLSPQSSFLEKAWTILWQNGSVRIL